MKRKVLSILLAAAMVMSLTACGSKKEEAPAEAPKAEAEAPAEEKEEAPAGKSFTVNVASTYAPEGPVHQVMEEFKTNIEASSEGRIEVVIHPSGALGGVKEVVEGLRAGTIEMGAFALEDCDYYCPEYAVLEAPYLFDNQDHFKKVMNEKGAELFGQIEEKTGVRTCAWFYRGARMITANKEIINPSDMAGLKFRLPNMPLRVAVFEAFGAGPTVVDFAELYMALKTGTVDAQENPPETIYSYKYYEAQKYLMLSRHIYTLARYGASATWMDSLDAADQELIMKAWADAQAKVSAEFPDPDETYIAKCEEAGMTVVEPNNAAFVELAGPAVQKWAEENGAMAIVELIDSCR